VSVFAFCFFSFSNFGLVCLVGIEFYFNNYNLEKTN
jgi:hypothetical protein